MMPAPGTIRVMEAPDIPAGHRLSRQAHWNQTAGDWGRLLAWEPNGCFVLDLDGQVVGTVTTTCYGTDLAWIGMVLVDAACRQRGFGRRLMLHALAHLEARGIGAVMLDATPLGRQLYLGLGFHERYTLDRWQGTPRTAAASDRWPGARPRDTFSPALLELDRRAFGADRQRLLHEILTAPGTRCFWAGPDDDRPAGYVLLRPGDLRWHIGPLVATDAASAADLAQAAFAALHEQPVEIDVPRRPAAQEVARRAGLEPARPFIRMAWGEFVPPDAWSLLYAAAGPEVG